jgi:hypothetical protein
MKNIVQWLDEKKNFNAPNVVAVAMFAVVIRSNVHTVVLFMCIGFVYPYFGQIESVYAVC